MTPLDDAYSPATEFEGIHDFEGGSYGAPFVPPAPVLIPSVSSKAPKRKLPRYPYAPSYMYQDQDQGKPQRVRPALNRLENNILPSLTTGTPTHSGLVARNPSLSYSHHPQTYAPLPAPLPTFHWSQPYPVFNPVPWHSTTPMMLPTQHTFAFTPGLHTVRQYLTTTPPVVPIAARICFQGLVHYQVWYL